MNETLSAKTNVGIKIGFALIGVFALIELLRKVGIFQSAEAKAIADFEKQTSANPFQSKLFRRPTVIPKNSKEYTLTVKQSLDIIGKLDKALGKFDVDENEVIAIFKQLGTKSDLFSINYSLLKNHGIDVWNKLRVALNDTELFEVVNFVKKMPLYVSK